MGRIRIPPKQFYFMTLSELFDAIEGYTKEESDRLQWNLWATRKQIFYQLASAGVKDVKEEDIIPLDIDEQIRQERYKHPPMTATENGKAI